MAVLAAAQLLDELMGRNRNVAPNEKVKDLNWEDTEYCKYFMVKFCPHDLFVNTRADLGPCSKTHDEEVRKMFLEAKKSHQRKIQYMEDFLRFSMSMINEVDRKIVKGKQRLALSNKNIPTNAPPGQIEKNQEKINILNERINDLEKEAEEAGTDGNVEQAQGLMKLCDQLKEEREELRKQVDNVHWNATAQLAVDQEKQMEVCEVCGAFLIVGDAQQRIDDHLMGKQHTGYMRLKKAVEEVQELVKEARDIRDGRKPSERDEERRKEREKRREKDKNKEKERDDRHKDKEEHRDKEKRDKERERDRDRDKRRTEDRERDKSKDKERDRESHHHGDSDGKSRDRERHRERDRERDRDRRHRDGSRHHHHHRHRH